MICIDNTQKVLTSFLKETEDNCNKLLAQQYKGECKIVPNIDLGFPHDVIRLAGGFATGMYIKWKTQIPFIPVDICMNACTVSFYEISNGGKEIFCKQNFDKLLLNLQNSSYKANFHRGNHFISYLKDIKDGRKFIVIHSSAAEFETGYNGLYPVEGNFIYNNIKYFVNGNRYLRFVDGNIAELFIKLSKNLYQYNENRHDFIVSVLVGNDAHILSNNHYHHYGMPDESSAIIGGHLVQEDMCTPLLTRPGKNIFLIRYKRAIDNSLQVSEKGDFLTPHGWGKRHIGMPEIRIDYASNKMSLDSMKYRIEYGESLRNHHNLELRDFDMNYYFEYLAEEYEFEIISEFAQIASYNKNGLIYW